MLDGTEYFECACGSDEHTLRFILSLDDSEDGACIYTSVFLMAYPFGWRRIWAGLKYMFGGRAKYGHFDCFILRPEDAPRLRALLDRLYPPQEAKHEER